MTALCCRRRPGWLYFFQFALFASGGRFMALLYLDAGLLEWQIGLIFASASATGVVMSLVLTSLADKLLRRGWRGARIGLVVVLLSLMALSFFLQLLASGEQLLPLLLLLRCVWAGAAAAINPLTNAESLAFLGKDRACVGHERLFGALSWAAVSVAMGAALDNVDGGSKAPMYVSAGLSAFAAVFTSVVWLRSGAVPDAQGDEVAESESPPAGSARRVLASIFCASPVPAAFLFLSFCLAFGMSIVENLVFLLFREELGASNFVCGVSVVVTVVFEVPAFARSEFLLQRLGVSRLLALGSLSFIVRAIAYTLVPRSHSWLIVFAEPLHGVTFGFVTTASIEFVASLSPPEHSATTLGFLGAVKGAGSFCGLIGGGAVISRFGEYALYRGAALLVFVGLCVYALANVSLGASRTNRVRREGSSAQVEFVPLDTEELE